MTWVIDDCVADVAVFNRRLGEDDGRMVEIDPSKVRGLVSWLVTEDIYTDENGVRVWPDRATGDKLYFRECYRCGQMGWTGVLPGEVYVHCPVAEIKLYGG